MMIPCREVFRSEDEGRLTVIYADEHGIRLAVGTAPSSLQDVIRMNWDMFILMNCYSGFPSLDGKPEQRLVQQAFLWAAAALPEGDPT